MSEREERRRQDRDAAWQTRAKLADEGRGGYLAELARRIAQLRPPGAAGPVPAGDGYTEEVIPFDECLFMAEHESRRPPWLHRILSPRKGNRAGVVAFCLLMDRHCAKGQRSLLQARRNARGKWHVVRDKRRRQLTVAAIQYLNGQVQGLAFGFDD